MSNTLKLMTLAVAATLAIAPAQGNAQATGAHEHAAHGKLTLDHGKQWPTDEALRTGMTNIRQLIEPQLGAIHAGRLTAAQCGELAQKVEGQVGTIVANCKLEPKADAMLHLVIADLGGGADSMTGKNAKVRPAQGAAQVVTALNEYGRYFDHPGWQPVKAGH
jgi:hypothetical protein